MSKTYHVNFADRMENALITTLLRAGVKMGTTSLLTIRGLKSGRRSETISVTELPAQEAAPILKEYLLHVSGGVRSYFDAKRDSPLEAFERDAPRHPVFRITTMESPK